MRYRFGAFELDTVTEHLIRGDVTTLLQPKQFGLLRLLIETPETTVPRERIVAALWPEVIVTDGTLTQLVWTLRKLLDCDGTRYIRTVPRRGYALIPPAVCLESARAGELAGVPSHPEVAPAPPTLIPAQRSRWRPGALGVLVLGLGAVLLFAALWSWRGRAGGSGDAIEVAVQPFEVPPQATSVAWLATVVADLVAVELARSNAISVRRTADTGPDRGAPSGNDAPGATGSVLWREHPGITAVLTGSVRLLPDEQVAVQAQLVDARTASLLSSATRSGRVTEMSALAAEIARDLIQQAGIAAATSDGDVSPLALPRRPEHLRQYAAAREFAREGDLDRARAQLDELLAIEPDFLLARVERAQILDRLGFAAAAGVEYRALLARDDLLPQSALVRMRARAAALAGDLHGAAQILLEPRGNVAEVGDVFAAIELLLDAEEFEPARAQLRALRERGDEQPADPRYAMAEYGLAAKISDHPAALAAINRAIEAAQRRGARALLVDMLLQRADLLALQGRLDDALADVALANQIAVDRGLERALPRIAMTEAILELMQGHGAQAIAAATRAVDGFERRGDRRSLGSALSRRGFVAVKLGDVQRARADWSRGIEIAKLTGERAKESQLRVNLATLLLQVGDTEAGEAMAGATRDRASVIGDWATAALMDANLGVRRMQSDRLADAIAYYERAMDSLARTNAPQHELSALRGLGLIHWEMRDAQAMQGVCSRLDRLAQRAGTLPIDLAAAECQSRIELMEGPAGPATSRYLDALEQQAAALPPNEKARLMLGAVQLRWYRGDPAAELLRQIDGVDELLRSGGDTADRRTLELLRATIHLQSGMTQATRAGLLSLPRYTRARDDIAVGMLLAGAAAADGTPGAGAEVERLRERAKQYRFNAIAALGTELICRYASAPTPRVNECPNRSTASDGAPPGRATAAAGGRFE